MPEHTGATRSVVNICPTGADRVIAETGQLALHGEAVEVTAELAERLLAQSTVWAPAQESE